MWPSGLTDGSSDGCEGAVHLLLCTDPIVSLSCFDGAGSAPLTLGTWAGSLFVGGLPGHFGVLNSIPGPHPLNPEAPSVTITHVPKHGAVSPGGSIALGEAHSHTLIAFWPSLLDVVRWGQLASWGVLHPATIHLGYEQMKDNLPPEPLPVCQDFPLAWATAGEEDSPGAG